MMMPIVLPASALPRRPKPTPVPINCPAEHQLTAAEGIRTRQKLLYVSPADSMRILVTEWSVGEWRHATEALEFCQILSGVGRFTSEEGDTILLKSGDAVLFHPGTSGKWVVTETLKCLILTVAHTD